MTAQEISQLCTPEYVAQIFKFAGLIKDNWSLCEFLGKTEKEYMVATTIHACRINLEMHGVPCSIRGDSVFMDGGSGLQQNSSSYRALLEDGYLIESECPKQMQADHAGAVVLFPTQKLLNALAAHFDKAISRY